MPTTILIADDHEVVRQGVRMILQGLPQWRVCGEAVNGKDAVEQAKTLDPDIIIMDLTMPEMSGIEATRELGRQRMRPSVLIFTMHVAKNLPETARNAGAKGLVLKSRASQDLVSALQTLAEGGTFFSIISPDPSPEGATQDSPQADA